MEKLDWFPLYIDNLLSSPAWQDMKDFQRGWYIQLLLRSTRSERMGYLPLDERLWALAGAHRRELWEQHKSAVMTCFRTRTFDAQDWIYNPKLLSVMEDQSTKYRRRAPLISPVISELDLGKSTSKEEPKVLKNLGAAAVVRTECRLSGQHWLLAIAQQLESFSEGNPAKVAAERMIEKINRYRELGGDKVYPWFCDGGWSKDESQWFGNGKVSKAKQRQDDRRANITAAVRDRYSEHAGTSGVADSEGTDSTGNRGLARTSRAASGAGD